MNENKFKSLERGKYGAKQIEEEHPCYGQMGFYRTTSGAARNLYGSSIRHHNTITLEISHSEKHRNLNETWYFPKDEIIRVSMSPTQFAEAISTMGSSPIPVTIERLEGKNTPPCPNENIRQKFKDEFKQDMEELTDDMQHDFDEAKRILTKSGPLKVADRKAIAEVLRKLEMQIRSNVPFIHSQFDRATEKTVTEARGEIEAFYENKIRSLGLETAREKGLLPDQLPDLQMDAPEITRTPVIDIDEVEANEKEN